MDTITKSFKLPGPMARVLAQQARQSGRTESALIREGIERVIGDGQGMDMARLLGADIGVGNGPADLAENRRHLAGYGRLRHR